MKRYNLANCTPEGEGFTITARLELNQEEYEEINRWFNFSFFYHTCRSMRDMTLESAADLEKFLNDMRGTGGGHDESQIEAILTTGNKLLISFLSFIKSFVDVVSNAVSNRSKEDLKDFQAFNRALYDQFFGYRFFTRMRNYVVHYNMPLTTITDSLSSGVTMACNRDSLLRYENWNTVRRELEQLPEEIDIAPFIEEARVSISTLYLKALETIAEQVFEANQNLVELCEQNGISAPIWLIVDDEAKVPSLQKLPLQTIKDVVDDLKDHPSFTINIIPSDKG